jgi:hypothetical protein
LLVARVRADDSQNAATADDLALVTNLLDAGSDLHLVLIYSFSTIWARLGSREESSTRTL